MLILCVGPDTWNARQKARELEAAFRAKFDPSGSSVERLLGEKPAEAIVARANTASLFSPRRFFLADNLVSSTPKPKLAPLLRALEREPEALIVVSVEEEPPTKAAVKPFENLKLVRYDFPELRGKAFHAWFARHAESLGVTDARIISRIVERCEGDAWLAANELLKANAGAATEGANRTEPSAFDRTDTFVDRHPARHAHLLKDEQAAEVCNLLLSVSRNALRVRDGSPEGIHPYVQRKFSRRNLVDIEHVFCSALSATLATRSGYARDDESAALLK